MQDIDERDRIQRQASVYMLKNPEDASMSIGDLKGLVNDRENSQAFVIGRKMQRFAANLMSSAAYMGVMKKNLLALM